jgi:toxin ParE1/3/4
MRAKAVVPRQRALRDIEDALDHYFSEAGEAVSLSFIDAVQDAFHAIAVHPAAGSPRYAHELNLPGLRSHALKRFPYLVFYLERDDHIDIWRLLHAHRDIPAGMSDPAPPPDR